MTKLVLDDVGSTLTNTAATTINNNNTKIEQALENTLSRDGSTPNNMQADIDMDSNDLLNVERLQAKRIILDGVVLQTVVLQDALKNSNNLSDLTDVTAARANLGLGNSATRNVGRTAGTVADGGLVETATGFSPTFFNPTAGTGGDDTAAVQAAIDYANTNGGKINLSGRWRVTKINMGSSNVFFEIVGVPTFIAIDTNAQTCVLEITRGNFAVTGGLSVEGQYKTNYAAGIWIHSNTQVQFGDLSEFRISGCLVGIRVGDGSFGASVTSELTLTTPQTFGCPNALTVEGGNTYLTVVAPPALSADGFGGDGPWNALVKHAIINKGSTVTVVGGEVIQTSSSLATDVLIDMQPGLFSGALTWGRVSLIGVVLESGGPLATITNPLSLVGSVAVDKPQFLIEGCTGFHSQDNASFIFAESTYPGDIVVSDCNFWFPGTRTQPNIFCGSTATHVYVDSHGFGKGFLGQISGTVGGTIHFSKRTIFQANGLPATNLTAGLQTLLYQSFVPADDHTRFQVDYNNATGFFTVPLGGFKNIKIRGQAYATGVTGFIVVRENGSERARGNFVNDAGVVTWEGVNIAAGTVYRIDLNVTGGAGTPPNPSAVLNTITIEAYN